jgi:poly(beta-D-mannuronate) lyase
MNKMHRRYFHLTAPLLLAAGIFLAMSASAQTYLRTNSVSNSSQLATALSGALPGDLILLGNGNYSGFTVAKSGTAANPITIQAANFSLTTNNSGIIKFAGVTNVILSGLTITTSGGSLTVDGTSRNVGMALTNCLNCRVTHCNFKITGAANGTAWVMIGGPSYSNRVDHCDFGPNSVGGGTHFIWPVGNATIAGVTAPSDRMAWALGYGPFNPNIARYTHIDHNNFHDEGSGDGEIMVLGAIGDTGDYQNTSTLVEYNYFNACDGDAEIISVKSSSNTLRYNTVTNSAGVFSLRAGNNDSVYGNFFLCGGIGGGIKLSERDHKIFNNYIENSDGSNYPLMLESGNLYNIAFAHAEVARAQIIHNTVVNPGRQVLFAHSGDLPVIDSIFANNIITGPGTLYSDDVTALNQINSSNIVWQGTNPNKSGFFLKNPLLTGSSPQRLSASSPAINKGSTNYYPYVTDDMDGQMRSIPRDIGADEFLASASFIARPPLTPNEVGPNSVDIESSASPISQIVGIGATNVSYTINIVSDADFTNPVTLTVNGLLPGMSAGFNPPTVNGSGSVTLNVTNTSTVLGGNYSFIITATSSNLQSSATVALQVGRGASSLNWISTGSGAWDIQSSSNWSNISNNATDAFYNGDNVLFSDVAGTVLQTNITIGAGVAVSPSVVTNNSSTYNFTISGAGKITGATKFVKTGTSTLTLNTTNDFSGGTLVAGGILKAGNPYALGGQSGFIIVTNGATLDVNGFNLGLDSILVSGTGVSNNGAIVNGGASVFLALAVIELAGNTTIGGANRWDLRAANGNQTASLSTCGNAFNLTKVGTNFIGIVNVTVDPKLANIDIQGGTLEFEANTTGMGNPASTLTISSNATLELFNTVWATNQMLSKVVVLNDGAIVFNGSGANILLGTVTLNGNDNFNIGGTSLTFSNKFSGSGNLIKTGAGMLDLNGTNTYTGNTTVSNGIIALVGNGSISSSPVITVAAGATLDASTRNDVTLTLNGGQILNGKGTLKGNVIVGSGATLALGNSIGTLTFNNNLALNGGSKTVMEINRSATPSNDVAQVAGTLTYGGTLVVTNIGPNSFSAGDNFKLFNAANYSGAFTNIVPVIPAVNLAWNTNGFGSGVLSIISQPTAPPVFGGITASGGNFIFSGTNGVSNWPYVVLTSTNIALPLANWTAVSTNAFDGNGNFTFTNQMDPNAVQTFYRLRLP